MSPKSKTDSSSNSSSSGSESESNSSQSKSESGSESQSENEEHPNKSTTSTSNASANRGNNRTTSISEDGSDGSKHMNTESDSQDGFTKKKNSIRDILRTASEQPDLYGVRRSGRQRREVERFEEPEVSKRNNVGRRSARSKSQQNWGSDSEEKSESESSDFSDGFKPTKTTRRQTRKAPGRPQRAAARRVPSRRTRKSSSLQEESESNSDDSDGKPHKKGVRGSHRGNAKPVRKSARRRGSISKKKVSYKEESEDRTDSEDLVEVDYGEPEEENNAETIEKVMKRRTGKVGATGSMTTFYNVLDNGDPNASFNPENDQSEVQFLIKWKSWSHIHNTWESEKVLREMKVNGLKKLENFQKKESEIDLWKRGATPEDIEYFECQLEVSDDLINKYTEVERIITHTVPKNPSEYNGFPEYLVKWEGLPYSECTWEDGQLITNKFKHALEDYNFRQKSQKVPSKICKVLKYRPKFQPIKDQPDFIGNGGKGEDGLPLRDYQMEGLNWLVHAWCRHNGVILADEMGLGKTIQTISFTSYLMNTYQCYGPFLMVVPLSTIVTWYLEFKKWAPEINVIVYIGDISSRQMIRDHEWQHSGNKRLKFNVVVTTYEILLKDKSFLGNITWGFLGVDEAHRLKNDDSLLYKSLISFDTYHRLLITGTPLQNSLKELWSLLHFIMPDKFDDWEHFEDRHGDSDNSGFTKLHKELEPYLLRRVKKDVEKSLPSKTEQILRVEMSKSQKQYYRWILTKNYRALSKGVKGSIGSFINIVMELKKCCNHSFLVRQLDQEDDMGKDRLEMIVKNSGKLILLDKLLLRLQETGHRVLIFSQMVRMLDILAEYLQLRRFQFQRLDGTMRGDLRRNALDHFNAEGSSDFCFLLSTRAGGLGVNLATADTVIIFDSDWNPQNDLQAQARAHRIGQKKQVSVYRLVVKSSVEEDIVERAKKKMVLDHLVIQRMDTTGRTVLNRNNTNSIGANPFNKDELNAILKFGAEELFKDNDDEDELQVDLDLILNRAETRETEEDAHTGIGNELLSQFKVVSFDNMEDEELERKQESSSMQRLWDDIIPEDERKKIDEQEEQQRLMELNLGPRERKQITDLNQILDSDGEEKKRRKGKKKYDTDSDDQDLSDDDSDEDRPKTRKGRTKGGNKKEPVKGFNNAEIRAFLKSFRKFGRPMDRLDAVAGDAELNEKSQSDLKRLAELLQNKCESAMKEHEEKKEEEKDGANDGKKPSRDRGPTFKIGSVTIYAKSVLQATHDLEPLAVVMPHDKKERIKYKVEFHVKNAHFDCPWDESDDANLLRGVYEYGMGSWEAIKMDPEFCLHDKILSESNMKPQAKHLQTRVEHLLKLIRKEAGFEEKTPPKKPKVKKKNADASAKQAAAAATTTASIASGKLKSKEFIEDSDSSGGEEDDDDKAEKDKENVQKNNSSKQKKKVKKEQEEKQNDEDMEEGEVKEEKTEKKKKKKKKKTVEGPMHFTTNASISVAVEAALGSELPKETFAECKEKMRPVKKSLISLDNPDTSLSEKEQLLHTRRCLLKIGDRINECLRKFKDPEVLKEWRNNLWMFVSKFTLFDATRLHKLYKHAVKKREEDKAKEKSRNARAANAADHGHGEHSHSSHHSQAKKRPSDDKHDREDYRPPNKKIPPDCHSDTSRDSQNARHFDRDSYSHSGYNKGQQGHPREHKDRFHDVKDEKWQVSSPLQRPDDKQDHRRRYNDTGYSRPPFNKFSDRRESRDRNQHGGDYHQRYSKDHRRDYGYSHSKGEWGAGDHGGAYSQHNRGDFNRAEYRNPRPDRPDYRQEHGFYGHRPPGDDGGNTEDRKPYYSERSRRSEEPHQERSRLKDPRLSSSGGGGDHASPTEHPRSTPDFSSRPIPVINSPVPLLALSPTSSISTPQEYVQGH